jgi:hypothetical protein
VTRATPAWSDRDAPLIQLCDELYETDSVSDKLWARLAGRWQRDQLLELIVTGGWYRLISYVINACGGPREPWAARFPGDSAAERREGEDPAMSAPGFRCRLGSQLKQSNERSME